MNNHFLVEHAIHNVWGHSIQDNQHVIEMARYTPKGGAFARAKVHRYFVDLPIRDWLHVYQIGSAYPILLSIPSIKNDWVRADKIAREHGVVMNVFLASGGNIPLLHCWLRQVSDNNILLAVEVDYNLDLGIDNYVVNVTEQITEKRKICDEKVYFRCYQNPKAQTTKWANTTTSDFKPVSYVYNKINNSRDFTLFLNSVRTTNTIHSGKGQGKYFIDGFLVNPLTAYNSKLMDGRILTYIRDETILFSNTVPLTSLGTFVSRQDNGSRKMVLVLEEAIKDFSIHYHDDIDFYITTNPNEADFKGVYLGRVRKDIVRQVAQFAYAIRTESINALISEHISYFMENKEIFIHYVVRDGGMRKGLEFHEERLNEMALLPFNKVKEALYGVNSVLPEWQAKNLEVSDYMKLVSAFYNQITPELVAKAYGYHALEKVSFNELVKPDHNRIFKINSGYKNAPVRNNVNGSLFRYNRQGQLIDYQNVLFNSNEVYDLDENVGYIEFFNIPVVEHNRNNIINADYESEDLIDYGFRVYIHANKSRGVFDNWVDVTGSNYYRFEKVGKVGKIKWNWAMINKANMATAIRIDNSIYCYHLPREQLTTYDGIINFSVESFHIENNNLNKHVQTLPSDTVDIFMNGRPLMKGIDYYIKYPKVVIVKQITGNIEDVDFMVRHYGNALNKTGTSRLPREVGFTKQGILSTNGDYDLRNDRNIRIIVDGQVKHRSEVRFAENGLGNKTLDGRPYTIEDYRLPLVPYIPVPVKDLVTIAEDLDEKVSTYITPYINPKIKGNGFVDGEKYQVVSPLISAILHAMKNYNFLENIASKTITDKVIETEIADFIYLLDYEPINNGADTHYVNIRPHQYSNAMEINEGQYLFLELIIHNYMKDSVDLTPYVRIKVN